MDEFLGGFLGVGMGFALFLPSFLFTRQSVGQGNLSSAPLFFSVPMFLGMTIMLLAPIIFWGLMPLKNYLQNSSNAEAQ